MLGGALHEIDEALHGGSVFATTTGENQRRRELRASASWRYTTPSICNRRRDAGTIETPSPAATRFSVEMMRGASWPTRGLKPAPRHAVMMVSYRPGPPGRL